MRVILPIGDVRCGSCGWALHLMKLDRLGLSFEGACWAEGCENYSRVVRLDAPIVDAPDVLPG